MAFTKILTTTAVVLLTGGGFLIAHRYIRADVASAVYRERLAALAGDYETLRDRYNEAVKKTAVTELVVKDDALRVRVRTHDGVVSDIPTPFDPRGEVYVDYVVVDGRLWIRRVFDDRTAPGSALVIDPALASIDWNRAAHGKAVYRRLCEGRWVVTVSGDGALSLARTDEPPDLKSAPEIKEYDEALADAENIVREIGPLEAWRRFLSGM